MLYVTWVILVSLKNCTIAAFLESLAFMCCFRLILWFNGLIPCSVQLFILSYGIVKHRTLILLADYILNIDMSEIKQLLNIFNFNFKMSTLYCSLRGSLSNVISLSYMQYICANLYLCIFTCMGWRCEIYPQNAT